MNIPVSCFRLLVFSLLLPALAGCGDDEGNASDATDTSDVSGDTAPDGDDTSESDTTPDTTDPCGGCPGVTACVNGACVYDPAVVDTCEPQCRGDIEQCVAGECLRLGTRTCYLDDHCTHGLSSGAAVPLQVPVPAAEKCVGADAEAGQPGTCEYVIAPTLVCPGGDGCAAGGDATLLAGASAKPITTACGDCGKGFELPNLDFVDENALWKGSLYDPNTFQDCGRDQLCAGDEGYPGPDSGESDGIFQGLWLAGFDTSRPALGVLDDTWVRAIVIKQGETAVALLSIDAVGFHYSDTQRALERLPAGLGIDQVVISSTHTHEAADTMGQWGPGDYDGDLPAESGRDLEHFDFVYDQIVAAVTEAHGAMQPAVVFVGEGSTGAAGLLHDSRDPIIYNDTVSVARFAPASQTDQTIATLVNWHSHPESLWDENQYVSSDFPHFVREGLENGLSAATDATVNPAIDYPERQGLGGVAIYFSGSVGGLIGPGHVTAHDRDGTDYPTTGDYERTRTIGQVVAEVAFKALDNATQLASTDLALASRELLVRIDNTQFHTAMFGLRLFDRPVYNFDGTKAVGPDNTPYGLTRMSIVTLGELTFYTMPGELFPETAIGGYDGSKSFGEDIISNPTAPFPPNLDLAPQGPYMDERVPGTHHFLLGLGHDEMGYIVPNYNFVLDASAPYLAEAPGDHYEETNGVGPTIEPQVNAVLDELIEALP